MAKKKNLKSVETITHEDASRKHIPTAECQSILRKEHQDPIRVAYERRNRDLDPQLVWRGKDEQDWSDLVVSAPPLFIQEKVHPKVLIDELTERTRKQGGAKVPQQMSLFDDFNGLPDENAKTEFYQHDSNWSNRMILGDSLQVMASLAEREGMRGKVQCVYFDPPYGIKFNSNFQWSTFNRDVTDGKKEHITREPEQVKAFRDTWRDGIHSYMTYMRDRLTVARDLLADSGSLFVQIGDENVHRVRTLLDEIFGQDNYVSTIVFVKTSSSTSDYLGPTFDYILWYAKNRPSVKYRKILLKKEPGKKGGTGYKSVQLKNLTRRSLTKEELLAPGILPEGSKIYFRDNLTSQSIGRAKGEGASSWFGVKFEGKTITPSNTVRWKTNEQGFDRLLKAYRVDASSNNKLGYIRFLDDYPAYELTDVWHDTLGQNQFGGSKIYVVQTALSAVTRCILMASDPGDLILDPTCGSGTTAYVAEQWGRRWVTIDTSRVSLALSRARVMGARYPYYILSDSKEGQIKEAELSRTEPSLKSTHGFVRQGFVYERVPHITLKSIAHNSEIDVVWDKYKNRLEPILNNLNEILNTDWEDWQIPVSAKEEWPQKAKELHGDWWKHRIARQEEIDASIAAKADFEYLYDNPYEDNKKARVAGPFTVESLSPHRVLTVDENDELVDELAKPDQQVETQDFAQMVLENLKTAGVQQAHKEDKIVFSTIKPWPGYYVCAEGVYYEGEEDSGVEKRAAIFIGPEFGTVSRPDLVAAAREAGDAGFDALIACAFNYDAHSSEFNSLGRIPVLKARMNADLHMADDLKNTGKGNLFVIFGEPDIDILEAKNSQVQVKINGVDVFHPNTGEVRSDGAEGIACWFIDTDYNEESFFVRHAYFLGANDPYKALKTTLKAEINKESWDTLNSDISRPFDKPESGRIAVKVINHLGDEVMKVYRVG
ncbi:site-specific DNA-methyltransferase [Pseudodesulfovibrio cashew]|uniref:site-specific DNA-methyltransferase (adenine-specific) n=1 Tax=Pseudodesulfovibrio cashew TaxID=2678688 RepID=A0A6I6JIZ0_9BACT|nr:site-specific DNA-methyltransferase [Pseudodesulfovibrio cashew]QGY40918.1 site-specific DNA-methyltransferase [Pseudodesulfovibrio cashew]